MKFSAFRRLFVPFAPGQTVFVLHNVAQFAGSAVLQKKFCRGILSLSKAGNCFKYFRSIKVDFDFLTVYFTISEARSKGMKKFLLLSVFCCAALFGAEEIRVTHTRSPQVFQISPFEARPVTPGQSYDSTLTVFVNSKDYGSLINFEVVQFDAAGKELARTASSSNKQEISASGMDWMMSLVFKAKPEAVSAKAVINYGGNPMDFTVKEWTLVDIAKRVLFKGIYDARDPEAEDKAAALEEMKKIVPATAEVVSRNGRPVLMVNGKEMVINAYKGDHDYKLIGEAGGDIIFSFNCGQRLFIGEYWDKELYDAEKKKFDITSIENNLLRIHKANPKARVLLAFGITPPREYMAANPENITLNAKGVRGRHGFSGFNGWGDQELKPREKWAWSYTGDKLQQFLADSVREVIRELKKSPASNIVIGFMFQGGHDGQFVQWEYGPFNGHFDYSEANRKALCRYLKEIYGSDAALQKAWDDPNVTLENAANPTLKEYRSMKYFDDRTGLGRKLADCRRFIAVGTARFLNFMAKTVKSEWGRPAIVHSWYSTAIWAQPSRLALDELVKDGAVNSVGMVSYYAPLRQVNGAGASANTCIQALNLRNVLSIQEMDHRTWRTQRVQSPTMNATAFPADPAEFHNQIVRDAASVIAAGGQGFYYFDMFGSWYHSPEAKESIRTTYAMNNHAAKYAGKFPHTRAAIFMDEATRLLCEDIPNYVNSLWRTSGVVPALHFLSDITDKNLPEYDFYLFWSPVSIKESEFAAMKKLADKPGKVLCIIGDAGRCSRDFSGTVDVLGRLGMGLRNFTGNNADAIAPVSQAVDPVLENVTSLLGVNAMYISRGELNRRLQFGYTEIDDPDAKILGVYERSGKPAFAVKKMAGGGTLYYICRNAAISPQIYRNMAKAAGIKPYSESDNAVYVGNGVAAVHRISTQEPVIDFGRETTLIEPVSGKVIGKMRYWKPQISPGECAAVCYLP